jgi:hypothetical protein
MLATQAHLPLAPFVLAALLAAVVSRGAAGSTPIAAA